MGPDNQHNFHSALNYDHGLPNTGSDLNIDQQILQHVGQAQNNLSDDNTLTAKAALAAHPHNKYPPPPDSAFDANNLTQGLNFPDDMGQGPMPGAHAHNHNSTAAAVYAAREAQSMNSKPTVGSPEWHQVRKNNHKEGMLCNLLFEFFFSFSLLKLIPYSQLNVVAERQSTRELIKSLISSQIVTKTRALYFSEPLSIFANCRRRRRALMSDSSSIVLPPTMLSQRSVPPTRS